VSSNITSAAGSRQNSPRERAGGTPERSLCRRERPIALFEAAPAPRDNPMPSDDCTASAGEAAAAVVDARQTVATRRFFAHNPWVHAFEKEGF